jgi:hypothetical protein
MPAPPKTWKGFEGKVAKFFFNRRTPLSGGNSMHNTRSDSLCPLLYIECKSTLTNPTIRDWGSKKQRIIWVIDTPEVSCEIVHCDQLRHLDKCAENHSKRKRDVVASLLRDTIPLAENEGKFPVVVAHRKGSHGFWLCSTDLNRVAELHRELERRSDAGE